ncbi:MAG: hypothetical protein IKH78_08115 [Ruminococcus sp.]|uniref:hypothetical protein n=1 Tax=Ralstonia pseudosolanacearum TaxID=1310165 RepID=UPI003D177A56|nr:hypothetical protein [Ruminococcus sp.]MBR6968483.1 hypothetical protein [Ruminococcus sp.]
MLNKLAKLIDVKSIVTLALTAVFCILAVRGEISVEHFLTVYSVVIAFYFGVQYEKHRSREGDDNGD